MTYQELLETKEWREKCINILKRDNHRCKKCGCFGYHPQSYYECDDILSLHDLVKGMFINDIPLEEFVNNEYRSEDKFKSANGYACEMSQLANSVVMTYINMCVDLNFIANIPRTIIFSKEKIFDVKEDSEPQMDILVKHYMKVFWTKDWGSYSNPLKLDLDSNFTNEIITASSFKFDRKISDKCIFSLWMEQYGADKSVVLSITYDNFCFTVYMRACHYDYKSNFLQETKGLNIHHKYYIKNLKPWEYEDEALVTLCETCHQNTHKTQRIEVYRNARVPREFIGNAKLCDKCGGSGYLPQYDYYMGGVCFKCWGEGVILPYE